MPYRDLEALRARHATLLNRLAEIDAQTREIDALRREEADVRRAIDETAAILNGVAPRRSLPLLAAIEVASPCSADWDDMAGDDTKRFCGKCEKNVYNLSAMTAAEAEATLRANEGDLCVRLYQRADGTVITRDCPVGVRRRRMRRVAAVAIGAGAAVAAVAGSLTTTHMGKPASRAVQVEHGQASEWTMGEAPPHALMGAPAPLQKPSR